MPTKKEGKGHLDLFMTEEEKHQLRMQAAREGTDMTKVVMSALKSYMDDKMPESTASYHEGSCTWCKEERGVVSIYPDSALPNKVTLCGECLDSFAGRVQHNEAALKESAFVSEEPKVFPTTPHVAEHFLDAINRELHEHSLRDSTLESIQCEETAEVAAVHVVEALRYVNSLNIRYNIVVESK